MKRGELIAGILLFVAIIAFVTISSAGVTELNVDREVLNPGDILTITGKASQPNEEVWLSSSFEILLPVDSDERYNKEFEGIDFPEGDKKVTFRAESIKNLRVEIPNAKFGATVMAVCDGETIKVTASTIGIEITIREEPLKIVNSAVAFSFALPVSTPLGDINIDGKKDVKISGDAADGADLVNLELETSIKRVADSNGDFSLEIDTKGIPEGEFIISADGIERIVYIGVPPSPTPTPTPSPSPTPSPTPASSNGGDGTPETTPTPSPTPTSTSTPTATPAPTATPVAASPTVTPASPAPATVTPSPSPTPSPSASPSQRWIPGFEAVFAIAGLLAVAYLVLRRKRE